LQTSLDDPRGRVKVNHASNINNKQKEFNMAKEKCLVKSGKVPGVTAECEYDFGGNLAEMVKIFGEAVVFSSAKQKIKPRLLDYGRALIESGEKSADVSAKMTAWKPGVAGPRLPKDPKAKAAALIGKLSAEEKADLLKLLGK